MEEGKKIKEVTTDMPIAIALMILLDNCELRQKTYTADKREWIKLITSPFEQYQSSRLYENLFRNNTVTLINKNKAEVYEKIYEHREQYHFDALIEYLAFFFPSDMNVTQINNWQNIESCYTVFTEHQTKTPNTKFSTDFCWKIASVFLKKHLKNNDACERNIVTYTTADETYMLRKEIIKQSSGSVYIAGTTLKDAFSIADSNREISIIWDLMQNEKIDHIYIFILNYKYIGIDQETASNEIEITLTNIMDAVLKQERKCPEVQIILLNNFSMPFELITNSRFLTRSTYVFDYSRQCRGQYLLFDSDDLEYRSAKKYLDLLIKNAYEIDMTSQPSYRDIVKQKYCCDMISYQMRGLKIKKINSTQFKNIVKASFTNATNADIGTQNKIDYFCIPNQDQTQRVLLPYLRETEVLLNKLVKIHDKEYGWAKIIPCNDLGFPNNVVRIAGGFLTGAYYNWSCAVPIVPIDATINTCTSSVFELNKAEILSCYRKG